MIVLREIEREDASRNQKKQGKKGVEPVRMDEVAAQGTETGRPASFY